MSELEDFRREKDAFYRDDPHSPLTARQRRTFAGLSYYPEDPRLRLSLRPQEFEEPELVEMQTSTGDTARYLRWARIEFEVDGAQAALTVYRDPASGEMFLPFQDANAGGETYGAGRYLEPEEMPDGTLLVDFNFAYNPYCAYNEAWSCPIPLPENRLRLAIRAGEMSFVGH
jgi:hypothetical protein